MNLNLIINATPRGNKNVQRAWFHPVVWCLTALGLSFELNPQWWSKSVNFWRIISLLNVITGQLKRLARISARFAFYKIILILIRFCHSAPRYAQLTDKQIIPICVLIMKNFYLCGTLKRGGRKSKHPYDHLSPEEAAALMNINCVFKKKIRK